MINFVWQLEEEKYFWTLTINKDWNSEPLRQDLSKKLDFSVFSSLPVFKAKLNPPRTEILIWNVRSGVFLIKNDFFQKYNYPIFNVTSCLFYILTSVYFDRRAEHQTLNQKMTIHK